MNKNDFTYNPCGNGNGDYVTTVNNFSVEIAEKCFSDESIAFVEKIIEAYPNKVSDLAQFCIESECFKDYYPEETVSTVIEKLNLPIIKIWGNYGMLSYCEHTIDFDHIIDIEFNGALDTFTSIGIDG